MIAATPSLLRLAADLLDRAADEFSNHGCNDFRMTGRFDDATLAALADLLNRQNLGEDYATRYVLDDDVQTADGLNGYATDFTLMRGMAYMLRALADQAETKDVTP